MAKKKSTKKKKSKNQASSFLDSLNYGAMIKWMWALFISGVVFAIGTLVLVSFTKLPDTQELENPKYEYASIVYSSDEIELDRIFQKNRDWVTYEQLSENVVNALIATEDIRFHEHSGIDSRSTFRALAYLGKKGGASTITQQLAKQFFTKTSRSFVKRVWQKLKEWIIAIEFEKRYTKEEIIAMYLNKFDFLYNSDGIGAAARTYFGKNQKDLNVLEAATLVGMLKNPFVYNPMREPENSESRRNVVLKQMQKASYITVDEYKTYYALPINVSNYNVEVHYDGLAPYFTAELKSGLKDLLNRPEHTKPGGGKYNLYTDGLKIYTTIDSRLQKHAQDAKKTAMKRLQNTYDEVWSKRDPWTYNADDRQVAQRQAYLKSGIERSTRYKRLRNKYLTPIKGKLSQSIENVRLWDSDIRRLLEANKNENHLSKLVRQDVIRDDQRTVYKKILDSEHWSELVESWNTLQRTARNEFKKKRKMKVFDYASGEKSVSMSPLDSLKYHMQHMQIGSVSIDPSNGHIKTWVGGAGYKYFQFDHVKANRQVGSTFKPFIYITAMINNALSPCQKILDQQYSIPAQDPDFGLMESWEPKNSSAFTNQKFTLYDCLRRSLNSASVWLVKSLGNVEPIRDLAAGMGIEKKKIPNAPSIALGTPELSVLEMTGAYCSFANNGVYTKPTYIERIEDKDGKVIYESLPEQKVALPENYSYAMLDMLNYAQGAVHDRLSTQFGGKTGTTNDHVDGWFMGLTPNLVTGTWVGGEYPWIRFLTIGNGAGSRMARPYFLDFMQRVEKDKDLAFNVNASFKQPEDDLGIELDCSTYESLYQEEKIEEDIPSDDDDDFDESEEESEPIGN